MILLLGTGFCNYENRVIKRLENMEDYKETDKFYEVPYDVNFKYLDGINTEVVINYSEEYTSPDYLVAVRNAATGIVDSRWFVTEAKENREKQLTLTLVRDIIADNYSKVITSPAKILRGWCEVTNSAIYNPEDIQVNQIKTNEYLISDTSKSPWIVGYISDQESSTAEQDIDIYATFDTEGGIEVDSIVTWLKTLPEVCQKIGPAHMTLAIGEADEGINVGESYSTIIYGYTASHLSGKIIDFPSNPTRARELNRVLPQVATAKGLDDEVKQMMSQAETYLWEDVADYNGKIFKDTNNEYYRIHIEPINTEAEYLYKFYNGSHYVDELLDALKSQLPWVSKYAATQSNQVLYAPVKKYFTTLERINKTAAKVTIPAGRRRLNNQPYSMFAMPYDSVEYIFVSSGTETHVSSNKTTSAIAAEISRQLGSHLVDIQLVPFCPIPSIIDTEGDIDLRTLTNTTAVISYNIITEKDNETNRLGFIVWCSSDSAHISVEAPTIETPSDPKEFKVENMRKMYRLCSPNYSSMWEFSPLANAGLQYWDIYFTYKPYSPFIRIAPQFGGLYGADWQDVRGLVCGGDYSLSQTSDPWKQYQIAHKNYDLQFNRQVETLEFKRNMGAVSSSIGVAGSVAGVIASGDPKRLIGTAGQVGNAAVSYASAQRAIEDARYLHRLEMENIQAQPATITKVGAQDISNKLFPILEVYDCTPDEKSNVEDYLERFSFNINRLGKIQDYIRRGQETWIEADLIRVEDFEGDAHELMVLKNELKKGVYL